MEEGKIYGAICAVMEDIGAVGKNDVNKSQGFRYRGIDAVMNALNPVMTKHKVFCIPKVIEQTREERQTAKGGNLIYSICRIRYRFYATDGSYVDAVTVGEGMDSGDKASNKAMAVALKYAYFQTFCIPTEELLEDPDKESPEAGKKKASQPKQNAKPESGPGNAAGADETESALITPEIIEEIRKELDRTGKEEKIILDSFGIKNLEDMCMGQYRRCKKKFEVTPNKTGKEEERPHE